MDCFARLWETNDTLQPMAGCAVLSISIRRDVFLPKCGDDLLVKHGQSARLSEQSVVTCSGIIRDFMERGDLRFGRMGFRPCMLRDWQSFSFF